MARSIAPVGTVRTQRNRKVSCGADDGCGFGVYVSRKQLVRAGVWPCPCCGGEMLPVDPDDAALVLDAQALEEHPAVVAYRQAVAAAARAQTRTKGLRYVARRTPDEIAAQNVERARREQARSNRLAALRRGEATDAAGAAADDPIPF